MKKLLIIFLLYSSVIQAQEINGTYRRYEGIIGKKAGVVVDLHFADTVVTGHYYYSSAGKELLLNGSLKRGVLVLKESEANAVTGLFNGTVAADFTQIDGTWTDAARSKTLPFTLASFLPEGSVNVKSLTKTFKYIWRSNSKGQTLGCKGTYTYCYLPESSVNPVARAINESLLSFELEGDETPAEVRDLAEESMEDEFDSFSESYEEAFPDSVAAENRQFMDESPYIYNWEYQQAYDVVYNEHYLMSVRVTGYTYTGGAHGNTVYSYMVLDLKTGETLTLDDLFLKSSKRELAAIAEKQLRINRNIDESASLKDNGLLINKLDLNEAFYIDHGGIGFTYSPYEIAPYADGPINIYLQWEQVKSLINPDGPIAWAISQ
ncbi:MAG: DUF3298 and DUF4163 domain-containing protein [Chitinophagales bacterium]|nr:DUF3298 and DUF4163 domain-containing protein [Chitinophagales bacterium]